MVVKELLRGYRLNGRIARASRVLVGDYKGPGAKIPSADEELIGAEEVKAAALPALAAEPLELGPDADTENPPRPEPESLEDIIAAAERQDAEKMAWLTPGAEPDPEAEPELVALDDEPAPLAEPAADDELLREAFGDPPDDQKR